ncbi:hypothetical protein C8J56DRAFT_1049694 [Mycena floridula]|nr:hypothetical protein C8J56DRAFT_1049694 [Mycena floridula]
MDPLNDASILRTIISQISPHVLIAFDQVQLNDTQFLRGVLSRISIVPLPGLEQTLSISAPPPSSRVGLPFGPEVAEDQAIPNANDERMVQLRAQSHVTRPTPAACPTLLDAQVRVGEVTTGIRVQVNVWPNKPLVPPAGVNNKSDTLDRKNEVVFHINTTSRASAWRWRMGLEHRFLISPDSTLGQIFTFVTNAMVRHEYQYQFTSASTQFSVLQFLQDQGHLFQLMEFTNASRPDHRGQTRLRPAPHHLNSQTTISTLMEAKSISHLPYALENDHFVINFCFKRPMIARFSLSAAGFGPDTQVRLHGCLADKFYAPNRFRFDVEAQISAQAHEEEQSDCDELHSESDSESESEVLGPSVPAISVRGHGTIVNRNGRATPFLGRNNGDRTPPSTQPSRVLQPLPTTLPPPPSSGPAMSLLPMTMTLNSQRPALPVPRPLVQTPTVIPSILWGAPYIDSRQTETSPIHMTSKNFTAAFFQAAEDEDDGHLHITGVDIAALVSGLQAVIVQGVVECDYSGLLTRCRSFLVWGVDGRFSPGDGIEEEMVSTLWSLYKLQPASSCFFKFLYNGKASLALSLPMRSAGEITSEHLQEVEAFGALAGLMLLYGKWPDPLHPCLLQYMAHNQNIHSLTEGFVRDLSSMNYLFESYLDTSVHVYHSRTERSHQLLACELLYKCVIGREPPLHPELQAFSKGFRLGRANGFDFTTTMINAYPGGSEGFLSLCSLSKVDSFDDMSLQVFFTAPRALEDEITVALDFEPPFHFETFIKTFLQGIGVPDHSEWDNVKPMFNDYLPLDVVNEPWFWSRMFLWAVTGAPELQAAILNSDQDITV